MTQRSRERRSAPSALSVPGYRLRLLGGFELWRGSEALRVPSSSQRLLAFLAVQTQSRDRGWIAGQLWTDSSEERAHANMRSALWRLRRLGGELVRSVGPQLKLSSSVELDLVRFEFAARPSELHDEPDAVREALGLFAREFLPEWTDDWVLDERERLRQAGLHALEALAHRLIDADRIAEGTEVALAAVQVEPLRESAHRALIAAHLAEGNYAEVLRQYEACRALLLDELGLEPSPLLEELMDALPGRSRAA